MSYEGEMLAQLQMPSRQEVAEALLESLFRHNGTIKEFGEGEEIVDEISNKFKLSNEQRQAFLETVYRKENRIKRSSLWHRLLFRAADLLAKENLVSRPTQTARITDKREWMLTEKGFNTALKLLNIPETQKDILLTKSFEVQKIVNKLIKTPRPQNYNPFDETKKQVSITRDTHLRTRGFRQAVIEAYDYKCAFCGIKINSPDSLCWEVEAAHIVPHSSKGRDDIWNGIALCRLHHWAFDVGWFSISNNFIVQISPRLNTLPTNFGKMGDFDFIRAFAKKKTRIFLPGQEEAHPHQNALTWHRENKFYT